MRTDLVFKPNATVDVYEPSVGFDDETGNSQVEYTFYKNLSGFVVSTNAGLYFTVRQALKPLCRISGITDKAGTPLTPHNFMYINDSKPEMDYTGTVIAWRYTLKDSLPRDVVAQVNALDQFADTPYVDLSLGHG